MFTTVITTAEMLEEKDMMVGSIIDVSKAKKTIKEFQKVVAVGPHVNSIQVGDLVCVNPIRFGKPYQKRNSLNQATEEYETMMSYQFDFIEIDGQTCLKLQDRDIDYVVEEYEEVEDFNPAPLIVTEEDLKGKPRLDLN
jgi:threonine dehydrogenase-like Zn-dependent dehydrogenase